MPSPSASALVIGAGIIGRSCALALQDDGWQVRLLDHDHLGQAPSWGNAGHIATEQIAPLASWATLRSAPRRWHAFGGPLDLRDPLQLSPWLLRYLRACTPSRFASGQHALRGLLASALPAWRRLARRIDAPALVQERGHWLCWESAASTRKGTLAWRQAETGTASFSTLGNHEHALLQSALSAPINAGIRFTGTAQIGDLPLLAQRLTSAFIRAGGRQQTARVQCLRHEGRRVHAVTDRGERIDADRIVVCAGIRSRQLAGMLGLPAPVVAERGYHLQWTTHHWPELPPVVFEDRSLILTRFAGGLRAAGFVEYAAADTLPDPRKWARLRDHVRQLGIAVDGEPTPWFGARPTLPDYLPALGFSGRFNNLAYAFGHQHLGLTLGAISGELLADLCAGRAPAMPLEAFDLERFA